MTEPRKLRVFLCHSSQDKAIVRELYQRFLAEGWIDPWLDEEKLLPGQDWGIEIEKAVETADAVIVCLSNNSVTKEGYVQRELRFVLDIADYKPDETVFVIPMRLDDCPAPRRLRRWQYVDYFPDDRRQRSYQRLQQSLKLRFEQRYSRNIPDTMEVEEKEVGFKKDLLKAEISPKKTAKKMGSDKSVDKVPAFGKSTGTSIPSEYKLSTICVETVGGVSTPIYYKDDPLPFKKSMVFSTAEDNQKKVEVHLVLGENKMARDNMSLGKYSLDEIPPAQKGIPQIEIQFEVTEDLNLSITATEKSTGRVKHLGDVKMTNFSAPPVKDPLPTKSEYGDFSDIFGQLFGTFGSSTSNRKSRDINLNLSISSDDSILGAVKEIEFQREEICSVCNGLGAQPGTLPIPCDKCDAKGEIRSTRQTFLGPMVETSKCPACNGRGQLISSPCGNCQGNGRILDRHHTKFKIPPKIKAGTKIKLSGIGNAGQNGGSRGDVFVNISITPLQNK